MVHLLCVFILNLVMGHLLCICQEPSNGPLIVVFVRNFIMDLLCVCQEPRTGPLILFVRNLVKCHCTDQNNFSLERHEAPLVLSNDQKKRWLCMHLAIIVSSLHSGTTVSFYPIKDRGIVCTRSERNTPSPYPPPRQPTCVPKIIIHMFDDLFSTFIS